MTSPALAGMLGERSLPRLLLHVLDHRANGSLVLTERDWAEHRLAFARGGIAGIESKAAVPSIGRILVERGALDEARFASTTAALGGEDDAYGRELVRAGTITESDLRAALAERIAKTVTVLMETLEPSTSYILTLGPTSRAPDDADAAARTPAVDPLPLVWAGLRARGLDEGTTAKLASLGKRPLKLHNEAPIDRFHLTSDEREAVDAIAQGCVLEPRWERIAGLLLLTRSVNSAEPPIGVGDATRSTAADVPAEVPAAPRIPDETQTAWMKFRYVLFVLTLTPLALIVGHDAKADFESRLLETVREHPEITDVLLKKGATFDELWAVLPGKKLSGAHLAHDSHVHWIYGAVAAASMLGIIFLLFERERARAKSLLVTGLVTGTVGILLLLGFQYVAEYSQGLWLRGTSIVVVFFYIVKLIGFSYRAALDADNGIIESLVGFTFGVGLCEELVKALPLVFWYRRSEEHGWRDACVWGLASGVGFGVAEGIMYSGDSYNGISTVGIYVVRFVSCVALHMLWTASAAMTIHHRQELVQDSHRWWAWIFNMLRLLAVPIVLHGVYDTLLKRGLDAYALATALVSFGFLVWQLERARKFERQWQTAV